MMAKKKAGIGLIRECRKLLGLNRSEMCRRIKMLWPSYKYLEAEADDCKTKTMVVILDATGQSPTECWEKLRKHAGLPDA